MLPKKTHLRGTSSRGLGLGLFALALVGIVALSNLTMSAVATEDEEPLTPAAVPPTARREL
jgi:hypothetical protein